MKNKRLWFLFFLLMIGFLLTITVITFSYIVPKAAALATPHKWNRIPIGQTQETSYEYFGTPSDSIRSKNEKVDIWNNGSKDRMYTLKLYYEKDSIVSRFAIYYHFTRWHISKDYLVDTLKMEKEE